MAMIVIQKRKGDQDESHYLPFGPYLAAAGLIVMFFGTALIDAYVGYLNVPLQPL